MVDDENGKRPSDSTLRAFVTRAPQTASYPPPPTPATLEDVLRETRATRRLLEEHLTHDREERAQHALRQQAIMDILRDILTRLP